MAETQSQAEIKLSGEEAYKALRAVEEENSPVYSDKRILDCLQELYGLRKDGKLMIAKLEEEIYDVKHNKMIDDKSRAAILEKDQADLAKAKATAQKNAPKEKEVMDKAIAFVNEVSKPYEASLKAESLACNQSNLPGHEAKLADLKKSHDEKVAEITKSFDEKLKASPDKQKILQADEKGELASENVAYRTDYKDEVEHYNNIKQAGKDACQAAYLARFNKLNEIRGGKNSFVETMEHKVKLYLYKFNTHDFFISNALYIVLILFFLICTIISPATGNGLLITSDSLAQLLENMSLRMFFALGVAGLILLGGTDLSIGRLIGMGTVATGIFLHDGVNSVAVFGNKWDFSNMPIVGRVFLALFVSVFLCTFVSAVAGFFSAKFKMHPFITTLATMLITYGFMMAATQGTAAGSVNSAVQQVFIGRIGTFPKYFFWAAIAYAVVWFIWNKTKFGKDLYAVGGNPEAASVSGISYFKVTFFAFVMAGILYGFGTFFYGMDSNPAANTGYGYELDAIASCVIGGISFFGGIGKISGTILGVLIFEGMTICLTYINVNSYWQFVIKGVILMAAVALDSLKYLQKK
ncbi:MAG: galactoside ABC transporter permease [Bacilli bacterium]|jgi:methyl-galactoside transport system permease protein|nr:galactoside ABC transporter permease [Bacilli bacterium]